MEKHHNPAHIATAKIRTTSLHRPYLPATGIVKSQRLHPAKNRVHSVVAQRLREACKHGLLQGDAAHALPCAAAVSPAFDSPLRAKKPSHFASLKRLQKSDGCTIFRHLAPAITCHWIARIGLPTLELTHH